MSGRLGFQSWLSAVSCVMLDELLELAEPVHHAYNKDNTSLCLCCEGCGSVTWSVEKVSSPHPFPLALVSLLLLFPITSLYPDRCRPPCPPVSGTQSEGLAKGSAGISFLCFIAFPY